MEQAMAATKELLHDGKQHLVTTPNPEMIVAAQQSAVFMNVLNQADLALPDGRGLLWAAKYLGAGLLPERVSGVDYVTKLAAKHNGKPHTWFLLGAAPGVADAAREKLIAQFPELQIVGTYAGNPDDTTSIAKINASGADVLLVAYGHDKQESWIAAHLVDIPSVKLAMGVGGTFDFIAGKAKRAPQWMRSIGLEWLWRLILQPSRIKRIYTAVVVFPMMVRKERSSHVARSA